MLRGIKDAKTESAVSALTDTCAKKFSKNKGDTTVTTCNLTWNGDRFLPGAPLDRSKFVGIRFKQTADLVFMPEHMEKRLIRQTIEQRISEIRKVCPGITLD